jgi:hypothetical protein
MKHKVSELIGARLDLAVAIAEGLPVHPGPGEYIVADKIDTVWAHTIAPSRRWAHGGPIIERERIEISPIADGDWQAFVRPEYHLGQLVGDDGAAEGPNTTPLIAAMRAYVASKFGDAVDLPD